MDPLQILIIEDDDSYALELERVVKKLGYTPLSIPAKSEVAFEAVHSSRPDLILLNTDIKGQLSGIELGHSIADLKIPLVFITEREDRETYQMVKNTNAIGYLVRPFNPIILEGFFELFFPKWQSIFKESCKTLNGFESSQSKDYIFIKKGNLLCKVLLSEIDWINSEKNYCTVVSNGKQYPLKTSLRRIAQQLPKAHFFQIHKSYIVRMDNIENVDLLRNKVQINNTNLPLGRSYKSALIKELGILR